jgi:hypothetical protein
MVQTSMTPAELYRRLFNLRCFCFRTSSCSTTTCIYWSRVWLYTLSISRHHSTLLEPKTHSATLNLMVTVPDHTSCPHCQVMLPILRTILLEVLTFSICASQPNSLDFSFFRKRWMLCSYKWCPSDSIGLRSAKWE